jgi:hypothetical protein
MAEHHPCGNVPVSGVSASAWYCHHHQAWWGSVTSYDQHGADDLEHVHHAATQFGPFDTRGEVSTFLATHLEQQIVAVADRSDVLYLRREAPPG